MAARVLVIEDNPTNLDLISYLLNSFGYEVLTAPDGRTGYDRACKTGPDLIVCDIQMPAMSGYEVARLIRGNAALQRTPLVAVTALAMVDDRRKVLEGGFDGYISKPIEPETFVDQLRAFLTLARPAPPPPAEPPRRPRDAGDQPIAAEVDDAEDPRPRILVVDNAPDNIAFARSLFKPSGYRVDVADNVRTGLALARCAPPDLILSDMHMPGGDGLELLDAVRADPVLRPTPFAILSCTVWNHYDRQRAFNRGADDFLIRPMEPRSLLNAVARLIAKAGRG